MGISIDIVLRLPKTMIEDWRKHKVNELPMAHSYSTGFLQEIHQNLRDPRGRSIFTQQDPND